MVAGTTLAVLLAIGVMNLGTGCNEKTSADPPAAVADAAPVENDAESGPVTIDDEFEFVPPSRASSSG
jgi:hypothetical protein